MVGFYKVLNLQRLPQCRASDGLGRYCNKIKPAMETLNIFVVFIGLVVSMGCATFSCIKQLRRMMKYHMW